ncbi:MAG: membrane protein insertion efficiency factor YidD [Clostridiales bacterium]|nr:membrane protein insertion efficiency factor YidD [Clostridiales bacterium]
MKKIILKMILFYQRNISPLKKSCCIYTPTCSEYTKQAVEKYGAIKGSFLGICRILRCNPFSKGGYDPLK